METLKTYSEFLRLKKPVEVTLTTKNPKKWDAFYLPQYGKKKLKKHHITISINANRNFETLLMHELIHAWQEENKKTEIHGKHFKRLARKAEKVYNLSDVFIKGTDK